MQRKKNPTRRKLIAASSREKKGRCRNFKVWKSLGKYEKPTSEILLKGRCVTCLCRKSTYVRSLPIILQIVLQIERSKERLLFCGKYIIIYGVRGSFLKSTVTRERPRPKKCILGLAWRWRIMFASILFPPKKRPRKKTTHRRDCLDLLPHLNSKLWGKLKEVLVSPFSSFL